MRRSLAIAGLLLAGALVAPRPSAAWVSVGAGIGYAGPYYAYAYPYPCPPVYAPFYPPVAYYPPAYVAPPIFWPGYGPNIAVRWNRYFTPDAPRIQGYTLPR